MIEFLSDWAEQLIVAVIIVTIIEMILPDNKNKKYIKMIIGIYILFNIISPFIEDSSLFSMEDLNLESYTVETSTNVINQESMDKRLQDLYIQEFEKNIEKKIEEQGYKVSTCKVDALLNDKKTGGINSIEIKLKGKKEQNNANNINSENINTNNNLSSNNILVNNIDANDTNVQMINEIKIEISNDNNNEKNEDDNKITKQEIEEIKEVLCSYYEIDKNKISIKP